MNPSNGLPYRDARIIEGDAMGTGVISADSHVAMAHDRVAAAVPVQPPRAAQGRLNNDLGLRADRQDGTVDDKAPEQ